MTHNRTSIQHYFQKIHSESPAVEIWGLGTAELGSLPYTDLGDFIFHGLVQTAVD